MQVSVVQFRPWAPGNPFQFNNKIAEITRAKELARCSGTEVVPIASLRVPQYLRIGAPPFDAVRSDPESRFARIGERRSAVPIPSNCFDFRFIPGKDVRERIEAHAQASSARTASQSEGGQARLHSQPLDQKPRTQTRADKALVSQRPVKWSPGPRAGSTWSSGATASTASATRVTSE
jgi:hypothetical protein